MDEKNNKMTNEEKINQIIRDNLWRFVRTMPLTPFANRDRQLEQIFNDVVARILELHTAVLDRKMKEVIETLNSHVDEIREDKDPTNVEYIIGYQRCILDLKSLLNEEKLEMNKVTTIKVNKDNKE